MSKKLNMLAGGILLTAILASANSFAGDMHSYKVTITNLTPGQPMAPLMVTTHRSGMSFFEPGSAPDPELAALAEAGNGNLMAEKLRGMPKTSAAEVGNGGTPPGGSSVVIITAKSGDHLSLGAMLGNTNDAFVALADADLPKGRHSVTYMAAAYDAGTETNDELCSTVPGPACGGTALSPDDSGEGMVSVHNGIHGIGGLTAADHDWRNPVAKIVIVRMK